MNQISEGYLRIMDVLLDWGQQSKFMRYLTAYRAMLKINKIYKERL